PTYSALVGGVVTARYRQAGRPRPRGGADSRSTNPACTSASRCSRTVLVCRPLWRANSAAVTGAGWRSSCASSAARAADMATPPGWVGRGPRCEGGVPGGIISTEIIVINSLRGVAPGWSQSGDDGGVAPERGGVVPPPTQCAGRPGRPAASGVRTGDAPVAGAPRPELRSWATTVRSTVHPAD